MKAEQPFFSIITPTYNRAHFLAGMIASVQTQSFTDYEHIIVDDGSVDGTEALIRKLASSDPRIVYINQENKGRSVARNVGMAASKAEFLCFLDSDDIWLSHHLSGLHSVISQQKEPAFYHTGLIWFYDDGSAEQKVVYAHRQSFSSDTEYVIANQFAPDCVCLHRSIAEKHQFHPTLFINEDVELWARIAAEFPVISIDQYSAKLRVHAGNTEKVSEDAIGPRIEAFGLLLQNPMVGQTLSKSFIKDRKRGLHELLLRQYEQKNERWKLVKELIRFLVLYPNNSRNSSKLVMLLYNLPGGQLLKSAIASTKSPAR